MHDPKLNYHHQSGNKKSNDRHPNNNINPHVYNHYMNIKDKPRPMSENVGSKEQKRIQQEQYKQQLDKQILENELLNKERFCQQRKNLNSACTENIIKGQGILSSNVDWDKEVKEKERLKKLDYQHDLKRQIEEKNQLKEKEKQKRLTEQMKYQQNENQQVPLNKSTTNKLQLQNANSLSFHPNTMITNNQQYSIEGESSALKSSGIGLQHLPRTQQFFYNNPNYYNENMMGGIQNHVYPSSCPQQYLPNQQIPQYPMNCAPMPNDTMHLKSMNNPTFYMQQSPQIQQPMQPYNNYPTVENLFKNFVNDQINVISDYEAKIENFNDANYPQMDVYNTLTQEKIIAMERIKQEQDKLKTCLGFYPIENQFNIKINNVLDVILENKLKQIQEKKLMTSTNNLMSVNNHPIYSNQPVTLTSNLYKSNQSLQPTQIQIATSNIINPSITNMNPNHNISNAGYRSKYEEVIKQSITNGDDINPEFKQSLVGFSKFVSANNNNISALNNTNMSHNNSSLMKTWKGDNEIDDNQMTHLSSIREEQIKYNITPSQILMSNSDIYEENKDNNVKHYEYTNNAKNKDSIGNSFIVNKDISAILPSQFELEMGNAFNDRTNLNFDIINNDISAIGMGIEDNKTKFNQMPQTHIDNSIMDNMKISKEEKDKTLIFNRNYSKDIEETNGNIMFNNSEMPNDMTQNKSIMRRRYMESDNDNEQCNIRLSTDSDKSAENKEKSKAKINRVAEEEEEEYYFDNEEIPSDCDDGKKKDKESENDDYDEYKNEFTNDKDIAKLEKKDTQDNKVDLNDYKDIHESQKFETKMNFFEDQDNISNSKIKSSNHIIQSQKNKDSFLEKSELLKDSYGDDIIKGMNKYHNMALDAKKSYNNY